MRNLTQPLELTLASLPLALSALHFSATTRLQSGQASEMLNGLLHFRRMTCPSAMLVLLRNLGTKLFVGGLSYDTNETALRDAFTQHGEITEVRVICHHVSGKSRGYGFVKFASEEAAASALKETDGQLLDGRNIRVHYTDKQ